YYILFNKCSDLRKTYKEKKDEIIRNEKEDEIDTIFNETFNRLYFLFNLNSEGVSKKKEDKNHNNDIINIYIKEHVISRSSELSSLLSRAPKSRRMRASSVPLRARPKWARSFRS
ncbi:MAG: hypothetical protein IKG80_01235, partial [Clostridia bacterium]|nr:hypothetical protein [Clostridia bacterium]